MAQASIIPRSALRSGPGTTESLRRDPAAEFLINVHANDLLERVLDFEPERTSPPGIEPRRPSRYDLHDRDVGLAADARHHALASDATQRRDLLADRAGDA